MQIKSAAFEANTPIPAQYTGDVSDVSPPLTFEEVPEGTRSLALIVDDPDAPRGDFVHWLLYDLPPSTTALAEGGKLPSGAKVGMNDFGREDYGGPAPPPGKPHRYFFKLYALDSPVELGPGATKDELEKAMRGHIVAETQLVGTYGRSD
jgi:hypothetical protein